MINNINWKQYTHLDPWSSTSQAFYEFKFTQSIQFRNYKIECYSTIHGRIGRFIGEGRFQKKTATYFVIVNGFDTQESENHLGENSLYGYPTGYSQYDGINIVFFLVDRSGNKYPLTYLPGTEPVEFEDKNFNQSTAYVNLNHKVNINPINVRTRKVSTRKNKGGKF
jgi:hypothetical protein